MEQRGQVSFRFEHSEAERDLTDFEPLDGFESFAIPRGELLDDIDRSLAVLPA